jgi:hypothetical protein
MTERYRVTEVLDEWQRDPVSHRRRAALSDIRERYKGIPG